MEYKVYLVLMRKKKNDLMKLRRKILKRNKRKDEMM